MFGIPMVYVWLALAVIFGIAEIATTSIVSIWFALGSLAAVLTAWLVPDALWLQAVMFIAVSAVTLYFTRPVLSRYLLKKTPTNADMLIGKKAQVVQTISPSQPGRVKIGDLTWLAKANAEIPEGEFCIIQQIEGASVIVTKAETAVSA
ncbi:MAG: NfeD family protein [Ruminococcaceae bacterium]|nr:NfeD family protein [Oscillospiraceae bacterium]